MSIPMTFYSLKMSVSSLSNSMRRYCSLCPGVLLISREILIVLKFFSFESSPIVSGVSIVVCSLVFVSFRVLIRV